MPAISVRCGRLHRPKLTAERRVDKVEKRRVRLHRAGNSHRRKRPRPCTQIPRLFSVLVYWVWGLHGVVPSEDGDLDDHVYERPLLVRREEMLIELRDGIRMEEERREIVRERVQRHSVEGPAEISCPL